MVSPLCFYTPPSTPQSNKPLVLVLPSFRFEDIPAEKPLFGVLLPRIVVLAAKGRGGACPRTVSSRSPFWVFLVRLRFFSFHPPHDSPAPPLFLKKQTYLQPFLFPFSCLVPSARYSSKNKVSNCWLAKPQIQGNMEFLSQSYRPSEQGLSVLRALLPRESPACCQTECTCQSPGVSQPLAATKASV